jgi:autotransporter-associated beta strand protein
MKIISQRVIRNLPFRNRGQAWLCLLTIVISLAAKSGAFASNGEDTWNSAGTTANWGGTGASGNWTGVNAPPITGDGLIFDADNSVGTSLGDVLTENLTIGGTNAWNFTNITFTANAPAYIIIAGTAAGQGPGAGFTLGTATAATVINQNSGNTETINDVIKLAAANQSISLAGGGLSLYGLISGTGGITLNPNGEAGILILTNASTTGEAYTGATIVGGGQLYLGPFPNTAINGIAHSSGLIISNGASVVVFSDNGLAGSGGILGSLPVTINAGGTLTSQGTTDSSHIRGVLTLNGGTLADGGTGNQPAFGVWDLDDGVVAVGSSTAVISANDVVPDETGGTTFNVAVTGGNPDLDVQGSLINGTSTHDTGIIKQGNGTMQLDAVNTYTGPTTISSGTLTINGASQLQAGAYAGLITNNGVLNYNSSAAQTFSGIIKGTGALNINAGTVTLSGANTYSGATTVASGANLTVVSGGSNSSSSITMAGGTTFTENVITAGGTWICTNLTFVDTTPALVINFSSTLSPTTAPLQVNGPINFGSTLSLTINGNALIPTGTYPLITATGISGTAPTTLNANVTINLTGVTGTIVQNGNTISLVVSSGTGPVTWNTGSGIWNTSAANWQGGSLYKDGDSVTFPDTASSSPVTVTLNSVVTPSAVIFANFAKNYILSGTGGIVGGDSLAVSGSGTLTISTTNNYTGPTIVTNGGTLALDFTTGATTNIISGSSALSLGSATLNILANTSLTITNDQPFSATAFRSGPNTIKTSGNLPEVDLGALADSPGASVVLYGPATITNLDGITVSPATATITTTTAGASTVSTAQLGIIQAGANNTVNYCAYATVGLYDWASTSLADGTPGGSPYTILGGSMVTGFYTPFSNVGGGTTNAQLNSAVPPFGPPAGVSVQEVNYDITNNTAIAGYASSRLQIGSLRFNTPSPINVWFGWGQGTGNGNPNNLGGILVTPNVGTNNIVLDDHQKSGINSSTGNPRTIVWQNNTLGELIFDQSLGANGPPTYAAQFIVGGGYQQEGAGTVSFLGINGYSVGTYLNGGVLEIAQDVCLGGVALGAVQGTPSLPVYLNGGTLLGNYTGNLDDGTNSPAGTHPFSLGVKGGGVAATAGVTFTVDGLITNTAAVAGPLVIGIPASSANGNEAGLVPGTGSGTANLTAVNATGTVVLNNVGNSYSGGTIVESGTLQLTTNNLAVFGTGGIILNGGTFQWLNGITTDLSAKIITLGSSNGTFDVNGGNGTANTITLANGIGNGGNGALTVSSSNPGGTLILSGANTYTGGTTVNPNSTLLVNGSLTSGIVTNNGTLGGSGTIGGSVTWNSGAIARLSAGAPLVISGTVTLNGNTVNVIGSFLTPAGSPYTLLSAAGGFTSGSSVSGSPGGNAVAAGDLGVVSISGNSLILTVTALPSAAWTDGDNSGNWSDPLNWSATLGTPPPSGAQATAIFGTGASPVNLDVNETVGTIGFTSSTIAYTVSGAHNLTLDNSGHGAAISVASGSTNVSILTALSLNDNLAVTVSGGSTLAIGGTIANGGNGTKTLTVNGAGTTILARANSFGPSTGTVGTKLNDGATLQVGNNNALGTGDITSAAGITIQAGTEGVALANNIQLGIGTTTIDNNGNDFSLNGVVSGSGNMMKIGSHTLTLGSANTYTGGTTVSGGFVGISGDGASAGSAGSLGVVPSSEAAGNVTFNGGGLLGSASLGLNANRGISLIGTGLLDAASGTTFAVNGAISGVGSGITVNSGLGHTGTVILSGANTYNGTTLVDGGSLALANSLALQNSTLALNGGTLDFGTLTAATIGALSGYGTVTLQNDLSVPVALIVGNSTATFSGILTGSGSLDKLGSGAITIGYGANGGANYMGSTRVDAGNLTLGGVGNMNATGNFDISGTGIGNAILTDNAFATFSGSILLGDGNSQPSVTTLTVENNASLSAASLSFGNSVGRIPTGTSVTVQDHASLTISGSLNIQAAYSTTANTAVLNLNGGTLTAGNILASSASTANQAVFNWNGGVLTAATNDPAGSTFLPAFTGVTVNVTNTTVPAYLNSSNFSITIAANLVGGGDAGLVKLGIGALTLSGANTYSGLTTISNGTLFISGALNNPAENFLINDGESFGGYYNGTTPQIGNLTLGNHSGGTTLMFTNTTSTSAALFHAGFVYLNGNCTIKITDAVNLAAHNEYPLLQIGGLLVTNRGAGFNLLLPGGVTATLTNDPSIIPGYSTLALLVTSIIPYSAPLSISSIIVSGSDLVLNATGGIPGATVNVLSTTNLALPLIQWTTNSTASFDGNGNLINYTIPGVLSSGLPAQFYLLQQ